MNKIFEYWSERLGSAQIVKILAQYLTQERLTRIEQVCAHRLSDLCIATEGIYDIHNALAIVRTAEAFGVGSVHLVDCDYTRGQGKQTSRGTLDWVQVYEHNTLDNFVRSMKPKGWKLAGACIRAAAKLSELPTAEKICILLGNENRGLSEQARECCDYLYKIPMYGMVESLNISVAGAISLYELGTRKRAINKPCEPECKQDLLAWLIVRSIGYDKSWKILKQVQLTASTKL